MKFRSEILNYYIMSRKRICACVVWKYDTIFLWRWWFVPKYKVNIEKEYIPPLPPPLPPYSVLVSRSGSLVLHYSKSHTSPYQKPLLGNVVELWRHMRQFSLRTIGVSLFPGTVSQGVTHYYPTPIPEYF